VAATAAELEEALQEVSRRGARIDALTCEVAWYRCACCRLVQVCVLSPGTGVRAAAAPSLQHSSVGCTAAACFAALHKMQRNCCLDCFTPVSLAKVLWADLHVTCSL